jgi:hypothetical protein
MEIFLFYKRQDSQEVQTLHFQNHKPLDLQEVQKNVRDEKMDHSKKK